MSPNRAPTVFFNEASSDILSDFDVVSEKGYHSGNTEDSIFTSDDESIRARNKIVRRESRSSRDRSRSRQESVFSDTDTDACSLGEDRTEMSRKDKSPVKVIVTSQKDLLKSDDNDSGLSLSKTDSKASTVSRSVSPPSSAKLFSSFKSEEQEELISAFSYFEEEELPTKTSTKVRNGTEDDDYKSGCKRTDGQSEGFKRLSTCIETTIIDKGKTTETNDKTEDIKDTEDELNKFSPHPELVIDSLLSKKRNIGKNQDKIALSKSEIQETNTSPTSAVVAVNETGKQVSNLIKESNNVDGTYSPKEKEILQMVLSNARKSVKEDTRHISPKMAERKSKDSYDKPGGINSSSYPAVFHRRRIDNKEDTENAIYSKFKRLQQSFRMKKKPPKFHGKKPDDEAHGLTNAREFHIDYFAASQNQESVPRQPISDIDVLSTLAKSPKRKEGLFKRFFRPSHKASHSPEKESPSSNMEKIKAQTELSRGRSGSTRSIPESLKELWVKVRSRSVDNVSSAGSSAGTFANAAIYQDPRQSSRFRRTESLRSLSSVGGFDIATRILQIGEIDTNDNENETAEVSITTRAKYEKQRPKSMIVRSNRILLSDNSEPVFHENVTDYGPRLVVNKRYSYYTDINGGFDNAFDSEEDEIDPNCPCCRANLLEKEQLFGVSHRRTGSRKCSIPSMSYVDGDNCVSLKRSDKSEIVGPLNVKVSSGQVARTRRLSSSKSSDKSF